MTSRDVIIVGCVLLAVGVFVWGFMRLYFSEKESHLKRVIKIAEGDETNGSK
jgi:hypothetical protein